MKMLLTLLLAAGAISAADKKPKTSKPAKIAVAAAIPADAVATQDGSYRYTDAQGKKWLFRNTPFGVSKVEDKPVEQAETQAVDERTKATEVGDTIRFERPGPFGLTHWEKKKSDLDPTEQAAWDRERQKSNK